MRRDCQPHFVDSKGELISLRRVDFANRTIGENFLKEQLDHSPSLLPIHEIDDSFGPLVSLGREICSIDNLFISPNGRITVVETKLWRNPEAAREVLAQILDYAKSLMSLSYREFEQKCKKAKNPAPISKTTLYRLVATRFPKLIESESEFIDAVSKTLRTARFMLLIVGDGIRENLEDMLGLLHRHPQMLFTFGLVEMQIYDCDDVRGKLIVPHLVSRTKEIIRAVVRIETGKNVNFSVSLPSPEKHLGPGRTLNEAEFLELIEDKTAKRVFPKLMKFGKEIGTLEFTKKTALIGFDYKGTGVLGLFRLRQKKRGFVKILPLAELLDGRGVDRHVGVETVKQLSELIPGIPLRSDGVTFSRLIPVTEMEKMLDKFCNIYREAVSRIAALEPTKFLSDEEEQIDEDDD